MLRALFVFWGLLAGTIPAQGLSLNLIHRAGDRDLARSVLLLGADGLSGTVTGKDIVVHARQKVRLDGTVNRYERTIRTCEGNRLVSKLTVTALADGSGYGLRESSAFGSRTRRIGGGRVRGVVDASWPEALIPLLLDVDAGRIDVLDLVEARVRSVSILPRDGPARYLDLPGGGPTLHLADGNTFRMLSVPGEEMTRILRAEVAAAETLPALPGSLSETEVRLPAPSQRAASVTCPRESEGRLPGIVLVTDSDARDRDGNGPGIRSGLLRELAWELADAGCVIVRFDPRNPRAPDTDWEAQKTDVRAAAILLRDREDVDPGRIAVVGHGQGGLLAVEAARALEGLACRVAALAPPARPLRDSMALRLRTRLQALGRTGKAIEEAEAALHVELNQLRDLPEGAKMPPGARLLRQAMGIVPTESYLGYPHPLMLVFAEDDATVPALHRGMLQSALAFRGLRQVRFRVISSADRQFRTTGASGPAEGGATSDVIRPRHPALVEFIRLFILERP